MMDKQDMVAKENNLVELNTFFFFIVVINKIIEIFIVTYVCRKSIGMTALSALCLFFVKIEGDHDLVNMKVKVDKISFV